MFKKFFGNTLIYALGPQLPKLASLFVLPIITRDLTSVDYGVAGIVMAYAGFLSGFKDLGIAVNMSNLFYRHPYRWQIGWRLLHGYMSSWSIPFAMIQGALLYLVIPQEAMENRWWIIGFYSVPVLFFDTTIMFGSRYYQFAQRPLYMIMTSVIVGSLTIFLNLVAISYLKMGYMGWFVSTLIGTFISFLFYFFPLYFKYQLAPIFRLRMHFLKAQLRVALPIIPHNYSSYMLSASDRVVMNVLKIKTGDIGVYNIAYSFGNYVDFIGTAIGMAIGPIYTKGFSLGKEKEIKYLTFLLQSLFLAGSFLLCLWLRDIFEVLISNAELRLGYGLGIIVIMGYNYRPMYWAVISKLSYFEKTDQLWKVSFAAGVLNILLNFTLIPIYGFEVAAVTSFIGLMYIGFSGFFLKAYRQLDNADYYPLVWMALIISFSVIVYFLRDISVVQKAIVTGIVGLICGIIFSRFKSIIYSINV